MITNEVREKLIEEVKQHRMYLHAHPELGSLEENTQQYIVDYLIKLGLSPIKVSTSTICDLPVSDELPTVALRADIDALAINEENEVAYKSKNKGVMHACGHDAHTAILLTTAGYLMSNKEKLPCNVRLIFQKDEESDGGAEEICDLGYLENISHCFGLHVENDLAVGEIGYKYGQMNAGGNEVDIYITGKQAHGAYPHQGVDALVCAASIITSAQSIVSRQVDPLDSTVVTIGTIEGGDTPNTICQNVKMRGTIRNLNPDTRVNTVDQFIKQTKLIAAAHNCDVEVIHTPSYPPLVNDDNSVDYIINNCKQLGYKAVDIKTPSLGLEDFAYYLQHTKGSFFNLGSNIDGDYRNAHSSSFDIDMDALIIGVEMQIANILNYKECK